MESVDCCDRPGIEPSERAIIAVKSSQHFRAAYAPIAADVIVVDEGENVLAANARAEDMLGCAAGAGRTAVGAEKLAQR